MVTASPSIAIPKIVIFRFFHVMSAVGFSEKHKGIYLSMRFLYLLARLSGLHSDNYRLEFVKPLNVAQSG